MLMEMAKFLPLQKVERLSALPSGPSLSILLMIDSCHSNRIQCSRMCFRAVELGRLIRLERLLVILIRAWIATFQNLKKVNRLPSGSSIVNCR